jgi:hypothetical protein
VRLQRGTLHRLQSSGVLQGDHRRRHDDAMGREPTERTTPDLFSTEKVRDASAPPKDESAAGSVADTSLQRHILPKNLRHAVKQLSDGELDELIEVVFDEAKRRGRLPRSVRTETTPPAQRPSESTTKRLPQTDKRRRVVNAIRASFKAGITPSRIARQFGVSQSDVRKALATDPSK